MTENRMYAFAKAWAEENLEKILVFFHNDSSYAFSVNGQDGKISYQGETEIKKQDSESSLWIR